MEALFPDRPYLKPWYRTAETADGLVLEYAQRVIAFEGAAAKRLLPALLPLLDGTRTFADLVAWVGPGSEEPVCHALSLLARHDVLLEGEPHERDQPSPPEEAAALLAATVAGSDTPARLREVVALANVAVAGGGRAAVETARLLRLSGVEVAASTFECSADEGRRDLVVVVPRDDEIAALPRWNESALELAQPWLLTLPFDGRFAAVGPLFLPGDTCCYECFRLRRLAGLAYDDEFWALERSAPPSRSAAALDVIAAGLAAAVVLRFVIGAAATVAGGFHALELGPTVALSFHRVLRVPRCPVCSAVSGQGQPLPWFKELPYSVEAA